jgi:two-component system sensor histidine kinase PilS (NtrC family)
MQVLVNELVIDTLADGVLVVDPDGRVHAANPAARELLGAPAKPPPRCSWPPVPPGNRCGLARAPSPAAGRRWPTSPSSCPRGGAADVRVRTRLTPAQEPGADSLCVMFLQDLREMEARLRTEKLAAMGRMSAAVAHEIRNPLAAISQANALLAEEAERAGHQQLSGMVRQNAQRLSQIVEEILNIARVQHQAHLSRRRWSWTTAVRGHLRRLDRPDAAARRACGWRCGRRRLGGRLRPDHLRRCWSTCWTTRCAMRRSAPTRSRSPPTARARPGAGGVERRPAAGGRRAAHLFEPFFSSESRSSGLGLYICRELCERHGARIAYRRGPAPGGSAATATRFPWLSARPPPVAATVAVCENGGVTVPAAGSPPRCSSSTTSRTCARSTS